jgi:general stress protein 26
MTESTSTNLANKLWKELAPSAFAFVGLVNDDEGDVPMTMHVDGDNRQSLWIFTTTHSRLTDEGAAVARYICKHQDLFARISGTIEVERDKTVIDRLWTRAVAAWYDGGREDPDLAVLRLDIDQTEIWSAEMSPLTMIKMLVGANVHDDVQGHHATVLSS